MLDFSESRTDNGVLDPFFTAVDARLRSAVAGMQSYVRLQVVTLRCVFSRPFYGRDLVEQLDLIGVGSLTVVVLTGFFTGAVVALQTGITLDQFGARPVVGRLLSASIVKEVGPVFTSLILAGRVGSGIAAEFGRLRAIPSAAAARPGDGRD